MVAVDTSNRRRILLFRVFDRGVRQVTMRRFWMLYVEQTSMTGHRDFRAFRSGRNEGANALIVRALDEMGLGVHDVYMTRYTGTSGPSEVAMTVADATMQMQPPTKTKNKETAP